MANFNFSKSVEVVGAEDDTNGFSAYEFFWTPEITFGLSAKRIQDIKDEKIPKDEARAMFIKRANTVEEFYDSEYADAPPEKSVEFRKKISDKLITMAKIDNKPKGNLNKILMVAGVGIGALLILKG